MKINKKNIIIAIVAFLLLVGIIPKVVRFITTSINAREAKYVALVEKPTLTNGEDGLELSGELKPYLQTEMFSRINGLVSERCVQLGDHVKKGQLLATIDTPDLDAEAASAKSALIAAEKHLMETKYQYNFAKQTYERFKNSSSDGAISRQDLDTKYNEFKTSEMNYLGAQADVDKAKQDLNRLTALQGYKRVVAPFDGVISKYNIDAGANVVSGGSSTSTSLFEIQQIDKFRATIFVPQNYVRFIKDGQAVEVYIPENPSQKFKGYISQISGKLDNVSRAMEVALVIPNDGKSGLYSGLYVKTNIDVKDRQKYLTINPACLTTFNSPDQYVAQVRPDSTIHFIKVKQGRDFGDKVEILEGLKGDEKLITNINDNLKEGDKVEFKDVEK
ncbi:efflux RND transporter periplasmic adaptor subunit [bacterium]|nr:efflux RND transporter periplasmic adaptor subunit [bacterium]